MMTCTGMSVSGRPESPLVAERLEEGRLLQFGDDAGRHAPAQVDAAGGQHLEGQVARFGPKDLDEQIEHRPRQLARPLRLLGRAHDDRRRILGGGELRSQPVRFLEAGRLQVGVEVGHAQAAGAHALEADVVEALGVHIGEQTHLQRADRRERRVAAFGRKGVVAATAEGQIALPQPSAGGEYREGPAALRSAGAQGVQILRLENRDRVADRLHVVQQRHSRPAEERLQLGRVDQPGEVGELDSPLDHGTCHSETGPGGLHRPLTDDHLVEELAHHALERHVLGARVGLARERLPWTLGRRIDGEDGLGAADVADDHVGVRQVDAGIHAGIHHAHHMPEGVSVSSTSFKKSTARRRPSSTDNSGSSCSMEST